VHKYYTFNYPSATPGGATLLTGIRGIKHHPGEVYISGFYVFPGGVPVIPFVYKGTYLGEGSWNVLNYPSSPGITVTSTNLYGPNNGSESTLQVVGNYKTQETGAATLGCLYEGSLDGSGTWTTLIPSSSEPVLNTIAHSTMGGLVVGNYDTADLVGRAFIYDIQRSLYHEIIKTGAKGITAYGIWYNKDHSYTICGGYSDVDGSLSIGSAYLVDWNNATLTLSNWRTYAYGNDPAGAIITHFDGITGSGCGGYNLTGDWLSIDRVERAFFCEIEKGKARWSLVSYPGLTTTSGNSVYKKTVIGSYMSEIDETINGYISMSTNLSH